MPLLTPAEYERIRRAPDPPAYLGHADLEQFLDDIAAETGTLQCSEIGRSSGDRGIHEVVVGTGPNRILLWSQMHGDEPTHTAVLCDLLSFFQTMPDHDVAAAILEACTLIMIPMLNPDGAELNSRYTETGVDLNRDARAVACPESHVLRAAVENWQPGFGFNLHNHNPRRTIAGKRQLASAAIFVPPIDDVGTCTASMRIARQVCCCFLDHLPPPPDDAVCRYRADYMPRAFGEWVQSQRVATVLVEAGGWPTPRLAELQRFHFNALLGTLHDIASGRFEQQDPNGYDAIPETGPEDASDLIVRGSTLHGRAATVADLGINFERSGVPDRGTGRICEIADLAGAWGLRELKATGEYCMPGRIAYCRALSPPGIPDRNLVDTALARGITTLLVPLDLGTKTAAELTAWRESLRVPFDIGLVAVAGNDADPNPPLAALIEAIAAGIVALRVDPRTASLAGVATQLGVASLTADELDRCGWEAGPIAARCADVSGPLADRLGLTDRGTIRRNARADLIWFEKDGSGSQATRLRRVMVGGTVVLDDGCPVEGVAPGSVLHGIRALRNS